MLASTVTARDVTGGGWRLEPKLDGWRALLTVDGKVTVRTRTGRDVTAALPEVAGVADAFRRAHGGARRRAGRRRRPR